MSYTLIPRTNTNIKQSIQEQITLNPNTKIEQST